MTKISAATMKKELTFLVTVNGRIVSAFRHYRDAENFVDTAQTARPDLEYRIVKNDGVYILSHRSTPSTRRRSC